MFFNSGFLPVIRAGCLRKPEDDICNIDFVRCKIRAGESSSILFELAKAPHTGSGIVASAAVVFYSGAHEVMSTHTHLHGTLLVQGKDTQHNSNASSRDLLKKRTEEA